MAANRRGSRTAQGSGRRSAAKKPTRRRKTLALIAHDGKKADMLAFAIDYLAVLKRYRLVGTKTTGSLIAENTGLKIESMLSGPMGGDAQIAAMVAQKEIAAVFFFVDPLGKHPHDPDIQTLMRICNVHSVPLATNPATAGYVISEKAL
jgi:methylglyoxal synthase